jgi:hypothetical protein
MSRENLPKKILMIKDCTFILPDDYDGTLEEAFSEFLEYRANNLHDAKYIDDSNLFSTFDILLHSGKKPRACGQYALYELVDGKYKLVDNKSHT